MNRHCLICESRAVMTSDAAKGLALLVGLIDGAAQGARSAPGTCNRNMLMNGLTAITPAYPAALDAADHHSLPQESKASSTHTREEETPHEEYLADRTQAFSSEGCLDAWITAYRKEIGGEAMIVSEQIDEWGGLV